jgi:hypothetical protein
MKEAARNAHLAIANASTLNTSPENTHGDETPNILGKFHCFEKIYGWETNNGIPWADIFE